MGDDSGALCSAPLSRLKDNTHLINARFTHEEEACFAKVEIARSKIRD